MALPLDVQSMREKWKVCEEQEDQKRSLITELFNHIEKLSLKLQDLEQSLDEKNVYITSMRTYKTEAQNQIDELLAEKDNHRFALVVIDGDCMPFKDDLVKRVLEGGKMASGMLKQAVLKELAALGPSNSYHLQIIIRVYANLRGLMKAYHDGGILTSSEVVEEFVRGFNMGASLCDFVDAGNGKECADEKVKVLANFQLGIDNVHCKRVLFGGSGDNGYARLLGELLANPVERNKVTLLQGPPFERELADIKDRFNVLSFPDIFRAQKLSNVKRRVPSQLTPPSTPPIGYAAAAVKGSSTTESPHSAGSQNAAPLAPILSLAGLFRNKAGERVDAPLNCTWREITVMKGRKLCNSFHLLGSCPYLDKYGNCQHEHGPKLSAGDLQALCAVARHTPCPSRLTCSDAKCILGHQCPRDSCTGTDCKFSLELHNVEKVGRSRVV